jgi:hypothetical protein
MAAMALHNFIKIPILERIRSLLFWSTAIFMRNIQPMKEKTAWFV